MLIDDFPACCGAAILSDFQLDENEDGESIPSTYHSKIDIKDKIERYRHYNGPVNIFCILDGQQRIAYEEIILSLGFRPITKLYNPKHESVIVTYLNEPEPEKSPDHPKFNNLVYEELENEDGYVNIVKKKTKKKI